MPHCFMAPRSARSVAGERVRNAVLVEPGPLTARHDLIDLPADEFDDVSVGTATEGATHRVEPGGWHGDDVFVVTAVAVTAVEAVKGQRVTPVLHPHRRVAASPEHRHGHQPGASASRASFAGDPTIPSMQRGAHMTRFVVPAVASIVVGLLLGAAGVFGVTLMVQQDTKPPLVAGDPASSVLNRVEYGDRG